MGNPSQETMSVSSIYRLPIFCGADGGISPNTCELPAAVTLATRSGRKEDFPLHILGRRPRKMITFRM